MKYVGPDAHVWVASWARSDGVQHSARGSSVRADGLRGCTLQERRCAAVAGEGTCRYVITDEGIGSA